MKRDPKTVAHAVAESFPREDPRDTVWEQRPGKALERGRDERNGSKGADMSAMFALIQLLDGVEVEAESSRAANARLQSRMEFHRDAQANCESMLVRMVTERNEARERGDGLEEQLQQAQQYTRHL